jgi:Alcohol dehydrogenase transcription factor Myb/SANT-like
MMSVLNMATNVKTNWSDEECTKLIEIIKKHPVLYKVDDRDYGKRGARYVAWKKVAEAFGNVKGKLFPTAR